MSFPFIRHQIWTQSKLIDRLLEDFVWKTAHVKVYNQKAEWFPALGTAHMAFWWVPIG